MMRAWMSGRRDSFPSDYTALTESHSASYRFESILGEDAQFTAKIDAQWVPAGNGGRKHVFSRLCTETAEVTRCFSVLDADKANETLSDVFERLRGSEFPSSGIRLRTASVSLQVEEGDRTFAARKAALEKEKRLLAEVRDTFLSDAATAGLWWVAGDHDRVLELGAHRDKFVAAVNLVKGTTDDCAAADQTGELINAFLAGLGPEHRSYLLGQLVRVFESYGRSDLADKLTRPTD